MPAHRLKKSVSFASYHFKTSTMKRIFFIVLTLLCTSAAFAQQGSWLLYGNLGYTAVSDSFNFTSSSWFINPGIGYGLSDKITIGASFAFGGTSSSAAINATTPSSNNNTTSSFAAGPFIRYTCPISEIFFAYVQADGDYQSGKTSPYALQTGTYSGFGADLLPAIGMNIRNGFALNFSFGGLSYQTRKYTGNVYDAPGNIAPTANGSQF